MNNLDSTKQKILLAAGPIFAKRGFRAATVREICDEAQVNLASINYYFGDKQQLYIDAVVLARQMRARQVPLPKWEASTRPEEKLRDFVAILLNRTVAMKSAPWQVRLLIREVLQPTEACRKLVEEYFRPFLEMLMSIIDEVLQKRLPDHRRLQIAFSIIGQCMYYRFAKELALMVVEEKGFDDDFDIEQLTHHITEFSLGALNRIRESSDCEEREQK